MDMPNRSVNPDCRLRYSFNLRTGSYVVFFVRYGTLLAAVSA